MNQMMMNPMMMNMMMNMQMMQNMNQQSSTQQMSSSQMNWTKIRQQQQDKHSLFVGNLDKNLIEDNLMNFFQKYGKVFSVRVMRNKGKGTSRGFGFITYYQKEDAQTARRETNGQQIIENYIRVMREVEHPSVFKNKNQQIYISNISKSTSLVELEKAFQQFGEILSCKIAYDQNANSLGYAYLQFESEESAVKAKQTESISLNEHNLVIQEVNKKVSSDGSNNLYVKNFGDLPSENVEQVVEQKIKEKLEKEGKIMSIHVQVNEVFKQPFAFICYEKKEDAKKVMDSHNNTELFQKGVKVYINQGMSKVQRQKMLQIRDKEVQNKNLFIKNVKSDVTVDKLKSLFSKFGNICSCVLQVPTKKNPKYQNVETQFGYISYQNGDMATKAISEYQSDPAIVELFNNQQCYLAVHLPKEKFMKIQKNKMGMDSSNVMQMMQQQMKAMQNPQMFQMMMNMMMPMMNMSNQLMKKRQPNVQLPKFNKQMIPFNMVQQQQQQQQQQTPTQTYSTPSQLKENINNFLNQDKEKQRTILGELLYPLIDKLVDSKENAPKITGMLIDFEVFEVSEILEFLENESMLIERIQEAKELLDQTG